MSQIKMADDILIEGAEDLISNLPDVILQHILCFLPTTKESISTSLLSRRWRHVWCEIPSFSLDVDTLKTADSVNQTLTRYTAPKTKSFHLTVTSYEENIPYIDRWIKFAMSHDVEYLSLDLEFLEPYRLPDFFYNSFSFKQLNITLSSSQRIVPKCSTVSWTSLKKLSLSCCILSDESMAKILSGCPILENLSLNFLPLRNYCVYRLPDFSYSSSSIKQLSITLSSYHMIVPGCSTVSWTSLKKLSLSCCSLSEESMAKILSGCPVLEDLTLSNCDELKVIDLSKSLRLKTLEVNSGVTVGEPTQIVAPHIHFLRLLNPHYSSYTLVDVASLTEAELEISFFESHIKTDFLQLQVKVLEMLDKLQNAEKLTLGGNFIQIVSLAEIGGVPFPMLKVKSLTLDTKICQYVIPGIKRLLQNSLDLEKLTVHGKTSFHVPILYIYLELQGLNVNKWCRAKNRAAWAKLCKDAKLEHVVSLVELMLKNCTEKINKMVVLLDERYLTFKIEDLTATLSQHNNVTIVLFSHQIEIKLENDGLRRRDVVPKSSIPLGPDTWYTVA
ncbi:putative F-box/LRR-repeat protein At3g18150 isoform X2 [Raphanus sativus]|uniref:F-box/LRR-repeat protein At3g18150 isoform X2 n=1 Tax=Raphanus sativus TaxID=3726 RepID=A0A9W3C8C2_RAPSA|nr:putative F-box/LRR-repeat protein At3g18150 isoform X2 [Raphanus sativus]